MRRKEILELLEEEALQEEQNLIKKIGKINIGRLSGKIAPPRDFKPGIDNKGIR